MSYPSSEIAIEALIQAYSRFSFPKGTGPITIYLCEECGNFHFTSKGIMHPELEKYLSGKHINRDREAERWLHKLKGNRNGS